MAKQVTVDKVKQAKRSQSEKPSFIKTRSPLTNLSLGLFLGILLFLVLRATPGVAFIYAIGAFMFFNSVDYCVLYYQTRKQSKETL